MCFRKVSLLYLGGGSMSDYLIALKDVLVVLSPIIVAYISYRSNKKSKQEIQQEIEKNIKEKDAETSQILRKIDAELESQKQLAVWNSSLPQTSEYTELAGTERYGNICTIPKLVNDISSSLNDYTVEDLHILKNLLEMVRLPEENEKIYPYEIPRILAYKRLMNDVESRLKVLSRQQKF